MAAVFQAVVFCIAQRACHRFETLGAADQPPPAERVVNVGLDGTPQTEIATNLSGELWVEIPSDIDLLKSTDGASALKWRDSVRASFEHYLPGHSVHGLRRLNRSGANRYFYELQPA